MSTLTKTSSSAPHSPGPHSAHASSPSPAQADDDPAWNPGKPLATLIEIFEFQD